MTGFKLRCKPLLQVAALLLLTTGMVQPTLTTHHAPFVKEGSRVRVSALSAEASALKVLTFNIRHGEDMNGTVDLDRIIYIMKQSGADVVALQEVDRRNWRSGFADQIREIGDALGMSWVFAPGIALGPMQYGNAILSKRAIVSSGMIPLSGDLEPRSLAWIDIGWEEQLLRIYNTHLGLGTAEREKQIGEIEKQMSAYTGPAVLVGDLNMKKDDAMLRRWLDDWTRVESGDAGPGLDHVLVRRWNGRSEAGAYLDSPTDHLPIWAKLYSE